MNRYDDYASLTQPLHTLAAAYPHLTQLRSISREHRDIWHFEITNAATGPAHHKPGFYIDGQIHAEEHITSSVVLLAATDRLRNCGNNPLMTQLLD